MIYIFDFTLVGFSRNQTYRLIADSSLVLPHRNIENIALFELCFYVVNGFETGFNVGKNRKRKCIQRI